MRHVIARELRERRGLGLDSQVLRDILIFAGFIAAGYILATQLDVFARLPILANDYPGLPPDEVFGTVFVAAVGLVLHGLTRAGARVKELGGKVKADEQIARAAMHDQLTGLPNRRHPQGDPQLAPQPDG